MLLCYEIRNILEKRTYFSNVNSGSQSMGSTLEVLQGGAPGRIDLNLVFSHRGGKTKILFSFFFNENFFFSGISNSTKMGGTAEKCQATTGIHKADIVTAGLPVFVVSELFPCTYPMLTVRAAA